TPDLLIQDGFEPRGLRFSTLGSRRLTWPVSLNFPTFLSLLNRCLDIFVVVSGISKILLVIEKTGDGISLIAHLRSGTDTAIPFCEGESGPWVRF
ncbi:MAG: hypothetical protein JSU96_16235, partial [Acidobacteriota bacterium]